MLPLVLVTGFLGAGKTTFLRHLLRDAASRDFEIGLVINEWGVANIDGAILQESGGQLMGEISGGCVCCTSQDEMIWTMIELGRQPKENRPDVVILELSGMADPLVALDGLTVAALLPLVRVAAMICVLDAPRLVEMRTIGAESPLLLRQSALADWLLVNKSDLAFRGDESGAEKAEFKEFLREINPKAHIEFARGGNIELDAFWARVWDEKSVLDAPHAGNAMHASAKTLVVPMPKAVSRLQIETALENLDVGVWRAKGFVQIENEGFFLAQYVNVAGGKWTVEAFETARLPKIPPAEMVFIGPDLNPAALWQSFVDAPFLALEER